MAAGQEDVTGWELDFTPLSIGEARLFENHRVSAVIFDLDGTLRYNRPSFIQAFFDSAAALGLPGGPQRRRSSLRWLHYYWAQSPELRRDRALFPEPPEAFWINHARRQLLAYGCSLSQAAELAPQVHRYLAEGFRAENFVPADVPETLERLKSLGYKLALLTNRSEPCDEELRELGLYQYFDAVVTAGEVNSWKPDAGIFHFALQRLGSQAEKSMYVGDNYFADVVGSRRAGLQPVLLDPDRIFIEANCVVIDTIGRLPGVLTGQ